MTTPALRMLQSTAAVPGWTASYVILQEAVDPVIIGLPVALWVTIEVTDGTPPTLRQEIRPYVINRHGQVADYLSQPQMQFLCISPPNEDWRDNARAAFDDHVRQRLAASITPPTPPTSSEPSDN